MGASISLEIMCLTYFRSTPAEFEKFCSTISLSILQEEAVPVLAAFNET